MTDRPIEHSSRPPLLGPQALSSLAGRRCLVSWSGGKDSCLALHRAVNAGARVEALVNMTHENGQRSRSHGLRHNIIEAQAAALGMRLEGRATSWSNYESHFVTLLRQLKQEGFDAVIFGDIDLQDHLDWEERVCQLVGMQVVQPLWLGERRALVREFIEAGFETRIVAAQENILSPEVLGEVLTLDLVRKFEAQGVDACGENGEFHTVVTHGPLFYHPLELRAGQPVQKDGYWFLDFTLENNGAA